LVEEESTRTVLIVFRQVMIALREVIETKDADARISIGCF